MMHFACSRGSPSWLRHVRNSSLPTWHCRTQALSACALEREDIWYSRSKGATWSSPRWRLKIRLSNTDPVAATSLCHLWRNRHGRLNLDRLPLVSECRLGHQRRRRRSREQSQDERRWPQILQCCVWVDVYPSLSDASVKGVHESVCRSHTEKNILQSFLSVGHCSLHGLDRFLFVFTFGL